MIKTRKAQFRELIGEYNAVITEVTVEPNGFYDAEKENSMEDCLTISFDLYDDESYIHVQRFVSPLTGGSGLFQQLLNSIGTEVEDEDDVDEQSLVGAEVIVSMASNKRGYPTVTNARANPSADKKKAKGVKKDDVEAVFQE